MNACVAVTQKNPTCFTLKSSSEEGSHNLQWKLNALNVDNHDSMVYDMLKCAK